MNYGTIKPRIVELVAQYNLLGIAANKEKKMWLYMTFTEVAFINFLQRHKENASV